MPVHLGCVISILCDNEPLEEFATQVNDNTLSCWIASEVGKEFEIHWKFEQTSGFFDSARVMDCYMDGTRMIHRSIRPSFTNGRIWGARDGPRSIRPFRFSRLHLTDDETLVTSLNPDQVGMITVQMFRAEPVLAMSNDKPKDIHHHAGVIYEQVKKVGSHCVSLGAPRPGREQKAGSCQAVGKPFLTVNFRYRSKGKQEVLQAMRIIPKHEDKARSPPSAPSSRICSKRKNIETASPLQSGLNKRPKHETSASNEKHLWLAPKQEDAECNEVRMIREQMKLLQSQLDYIQASQSMKHVKREISPIRGSFTPGEVIDLT